MHLSRAVPVLAAFLLLAAIAPGLPAQTAAPSPPAPVTGCRGTNSQTSSISLTVRGEEVEIPSYPVIESVQPGSPAQRAGMRAGDMVVMQDGHDVVADPPTRAYAPGDTVRLVVRRNDVETPITVVLGRWSQDTPNAERICRPI